MRLLGMIIASLTLLCLLCAPALAQSSPSASQYQGGGSGYCPPNTTCVQSLGDGADDLSENAEQGTDAVNDAMEDAPSNASAVSGGASASDGVESVASATAESSPTEGDVAGEDGEGPASITRLPETGGASLAALGSGILLATSGLMVRRIVG